MKYLRTAIVLSWVFLIVLVSTAALADSTNKSYSKPTVWNLGTPILIANICKDEETILRIVAADTVSEEEVLGQLRGFHLSGMCVRFPTPLLFMVTHSLIQYADFNGVESVVLGVSGKENNFLGWVLAGGVFSKELNKPTKGITI